MGHDPSRHSQLHLVKTSRGYSICTQKWTALTLSDEKGKQKNLSVVVSLKIDDNKDSVSKEREGMVFTDNARLVLVQYNIKLSLFNRCLFIEFYLNSLQCSKSLILSKYGH